MESVACALCKSTQTTLWLTTTDRLSGESFGIVQCRRCGLRYTNPRPSRHELTRYYPASAPPSGPRRMIRRWLRRRRARWCAGDLPPGRALEIGCGSGWMLQTLQGAGWEVVGTERSADSAMHARRLGLDVLVGDVTRHGLPAGAFDLVILWHVLEHLYDPRATLVAVRRLMPPSGRLVIAVPNASSWQARLAGRRWFHLDVPRHLYHFDPTTLEALLHSSGFRIHRWSRASPAYELRGWWELAGDTTARNTATRASASLAALALTALSTTAACHKISAAIAVQASPVCLPRGLV